MPPEDFALGVFFYILEKYSYGYICIGALACKVIV